MSVSLALIAAQRADSICDLDIAECTALSRAASNAGGARSVVTERHR
jgi:hypothetical protein